MAGGFSNYLEAIILEHIFIQDYLPPTLYVGLCIADPADTGTGANCNEVPNAGSYIRLSTSAGAGGDWELSGTPGIIYNKNALTFATPSASWGTVTHFAILDDSVYGQGNMLIYGPLVPAVLIVSGSIPRFSAGAMTMMLT